jgi:arylsulfatase A-like enzyme
MHSQALASSRWGAVALRGLGVLLLALASACDRPAAPDQPSFLVVSLDTTRASQMGLYGHTRRTTPQIDAVADRGLVFDRAFTLAPNTLEAHASLFTGLLPSAHDVHDRGEGQAIPPDARTLAEDFLAAGYQTAGFAAHGDWLTERFGMDRGFERFSSSYRPARDVLAEASTFLRERDPARPFFLFVHLFDAHSDWASRAYDAPFPFAGRFTEGAGGPARDPASGGLTGSQFLKAIGAGDVSVTPEQLESLRAEYDEGLAALDSQLGSFLHGARASLDQAYVVLTADHGEAFLEHGEMLHGTLHDEVMRVPLVMLPPQGRVHGLGAPRRVEEPVSLVDLRATLLGLAGLPEPLFSQGADWTDWMARRPGPSSASPVFLTSQGVVYQGLKYFTTEERGSELYDLRDDPGEQHNLFGDARYADRRRTLELLVADMGQRSQSLRDAITAGGLGDAPGTGDEMRERLASLGYVGAGARAEVLPPTLDGYTFPIGVYVLGAPAAPNDPETSGGALTGFRATPDLPPGLVIDPATGRITGTPNQTRPVQEHLITARSPSGAVLETRITTRVVAPRLRYPAPEVTLLLGEEALPLVPEPLGARPVQVAIQPELPPGLRLDASTGVISGRASATSARTEYTVTASFEGHPESSCRLALEVQARPR